MDFLFNAFLAKFLELGNMNASQLVKEQHGIKAGF